MFCNGSRLYTLAFTLFLLVGAMPPQVAKAQEASLNNVSELVLGAVSSNPRKDFPKLTCLAEYLTDQLQGQEAISPRVVLTRTREEMASLLKQGEVDLVTETVYGALYFSSKAEAEFMLREWRRNKPEYWSVIFVRKDSGITSIEDLRGRTIAFEDPGSTSGCYLPRLALEQAGLSLAEIPPGTPCPPEQVGFSFARSEKNIPQWVHGQVTDAGALSNEDWKKDKFFPSGIRKDLVIIGNSMPVPRAIVLNRKGFPEDLKHRIQDILCSLPQGRSPLFRYRKRVRYDLLPDRVRADLTELASTPR